MIRPLLGAAIATSALAAGAPQAMAEPAAFSTPYYSLLLTLDPAGHRLGALARIRVIPRQSGPQTLALRLHEGLKVTRVALNERPVRFTRSGDQLSVSLNGTAGQKAVLSVTYAGRPLMALNDRKLQDIGADGALLHPKGLWYPQLPESAATTASVHLTLPAGWLASGPASKVVAEGRTHHLEFTSPGPLALAAGRYQAHRLPGLTAYLGPRAIEPGALKEGAALLAMYRAHGLGGVAGTLIELPAGFRSLSMPGWQARPVAGEHVADWLALGVWSGREAASPLERQWLGHSLVAYSRDLLAEAREGKGAYQKAWSRHLESYQAYQRQHGGEELPLSEAIAPTSPAWAPVVLDRGALVWGLLRDAVGDAAFWGALKRYQAGLAGGASGLGALQAALGRQADFVDSWLAQPGLPVLRWKQLELQRNEDGRYQVKGLLKQEGTPLQLPLTLALVCEDSVQRVSFQSFSDQMPVHFVANSRPLRLMLDPGDRAPVARRQELLIAEGVAPVDGVLVYGTRGTPEETEANLQAARAMQERLRRFKALYLPLRADNELGADERKRSLLLFGRPGTNSVVAELENQFPVRFVSGKAVWWQGRTYQHPRHGTVQIIANPFAPDATVVLFAAMSPEGMADTLTHTQRQATFCVFDEDGVLEEGRTLRPFPDLDAVLY